MKNALLLCIVIIAIVGCSKETSRDRTENKIAELELRLNETKDEISRLKANQEVTDFLLKFHDDAYLTPGANGYQQINSDITKLTVMISDIQPYANGSRVSLRFGNISGATLSGLKAKIEWGPVDKEGNPVASDKKTREMEFKSQFRAGSWTVVPVILEERPHQRWGLCAYHRYLIWELVLIPASSNAVSYLRALASTQ